MFLLPGDSCETAAAATAVFGAKALIPALILGEGLLRTPTVLPLLFGEEGGDAGGGDEACCGPPRCHSFTIDATLPFDGDADADAGLS